MAWKPKGSPTPLNFGPNHRLARSWPPSGTPRECRLWTSCLVDLRSRGVLCRLRGSIRQKRRGKLTRGVVLHDNTLVHKGCRAQAALRDCGFEKLSHPPYSPDLAPSDYFLFSQLKSSLRGRRFYDDDEVKEAVMMWLEEQLESFWLAEIRSLRDKWFKCIQVKGVERQIVLSSGGGWGRRGGPACRLQRVKAGTAGVTWFKLTMAVLKVRVRESWVAVRGARQTSWERRVEALGRVRGREGKRESVGLASFSPLGDSLGQCLHSLRLSGLKCDERESCFVMTEAAAPSTHIIVAAVLARYFIARLNFRLNKEATLRCDKLISLAETSDAALMFECICVTRKLGIHSG
ncbi:hypothetical protein O3P69_000304 [Scylla paramamosain]|uniref:Histone-lysine N-methyltransferase SETMAR n=1 Tax=Scylla paramamosain TaxID=85552 RepID=A0AAW0UW70_SCYPA